MKYLRTYEENLFDVRILKKVFNVAYDKAIEHLKKTHKNINEENIFIFINQLVFNNYGIDLSQTRDKYIKHLIHNEFRKNEQLLENKEAVDSKDLFGAIRSQSMKWLKELLEQGADINVQNKIGMTPLIFIVNLDFNDSKKVKIIDFLVQNGANLDIQDCFGRTTLIVAAQRYKIFNNSEILNYLIDLGFDWYKKDNKGKYFIDYLDKSYKEKLERKYPEKYNNLMLKIKAEQYNL